MANGKGQIQNIKGRAAKRLGTLALRAGISGACACLPDWRCGILRLVV